MPRGHCHDWFRKWKKDHNFCGLRPQDAKEMDQYIDIAEKIAHASGKDEDFVHDHFTAGAARPLLRCKDDTAGTKALNYVVACLKRDEDITGGDLQATIEGFMGKKPAKSTQMRKPEPVKEPCPGGEMCPDCPDPCSIVDKCKPILSLAAQQAEKEQHVHPGAICTVNPVVINDTLRERPPIITDTTGKVSPVRDNQETAGNHHTAVKNGGVPAGSTTTAESKSPAVKSSPFKTAAQVMAHDKDPLGVGDMFREASLKDCAALIAEPPQDPAKVLKEKRIQLAEDLLSCLTERFQISVRDYLQYVHRNGEKTAFDVFYFGAEKMINEKKETTSSAGAAMRRA